LSEAIVSLVIVPRERFSESLASLDSVLEHTRGPYELAYVDAGSPRSIREGLRSRARHHGFRLIRTEQMLSPNRARNLGLAHARGRYVAFLDNDVIVTPGWLEPLIACAEETGAAVVGPLICEGRPVHQIVHFAGGEARVEEKEVDGTLTRRLVEVVHGQLEPLDALRPGLRRAPCELAELHCLLARREIFDRVGPLDESLSTKEHLDFCMRVRDAGESVYLEPASVVTFLIGPPTLSDMVYYMLRWSDAWERSSLEHFRDTWRLQGDPWLERRAAMIGWRRRKYIAEHWALRLCLGFKLPPVRRLLERIDRALNARLTRSYARQHGPARSA
jgi:GT2 family glycosyltransferase